MQELHTAPAESSRIVNEPPERTPIARLVLHELAERGGCWVGSREQLAAVLGCSARHLARVVDALEADGWIRSAPKRLTLAAEVPSKRQLTPKTGHGTDAKTPKTPKMASICIPEGWVSSQPLAGSGGAAGPGGPLTPPSERQGAGRWGVHVGQVEVWETPRKGRLPLLHLSHWTLPTADRRAALIRGGWRYEPQGHTWTTPATPEARAFVAGEAVDPWVTGLVTYWTENKYWAVQLVAAPPAPIRRWLADVGAWPERFCAVRQRTLKRNEESYSWAWIWRVPVVHARAVIARVCGVEVTEERELCAAPRVDVEPVDPSEVADRLAELTPPGWGLEMHAGRPRWVAPSSAAACWVVFDQLAERCRDLGLQPPELRMESPDVQRGRVVSTPPTAYGDAAPAWMPWAQPDADRLEWPEVVQAWGLRASIGVRWGEGFSAEHAARLRELGARAAVVPWRSSSRVVECEPQDPDVWGPLDDAAPVTEEWIRAWRDASAGGWWVWWIPRGVERLVCAAVSDLERRPLPPPPSSWGVPHVGAIYTRPIRAVEEQPDEPPAFGMADPARWVPPVVEAPAQPAARGPLAVLERTRPAASPGPEAPAVSQSSAWSPPPEEWAKLWEALKKPALAERSRARGRT